MRVAILSSSGKDSTYACWWAIMQGWSVEALITVHITTDDSMMFQLQNTWISAFQASSMGIPWRPVISSGEAEKEVIDLEKSINSEVVDFDDNVPGLDHLRV